MGENMKPFIVSTKVSKQKKNLCVIRLKYKNLFHSEECSKTLLNRCNLPGMCHFSRCSCWFNGTVWGLFTFCSHQFWAKASWERKKTERRVSLCLNVFSCLSTKIDKKRTRRGRIVQEGLDWNPSSFRTEWVCSPTGGCRTFGTSSQLVLSAMSLLLHARILWHLCYFCINPKQFA